MVRAFHWVFACVALVAVASCNRAGSSAPDNWAHQIAATYYDTRGDGAAIARMSQAAEVETTLNALRTALGEERSARIGAERIGFILEYPPIWHADHLIADQWEARRARISMLPDAEVGQWRSAFQSTGQAPSELWTIGYMIDTPSLFKNNSFDAARSSVLMERLSKLSPEAVGLIAAPLHIDRAWAAMLIIQNDELFNGADINADKFATAVQALDQTVAPTDTATATTQTTATTATTHTTTGTHP